MLQIEDYKGGAVAKLLQHGGNHHEAKPRRVYCDQEEYDLEGQTDADETVVEGGVSDGRRIFLPDQVEDEIQGREDQNAPNACGPKNDLGEFHGTNYSPPTVRPSMRSVGAATEPRNSRSFAISEMLKNRSFRLPATVISSTG